MALRVLTRDENGRRRKRQLVSADGRAFYAGEVVRILKLPRLEYRQLCRLFDLVRPNDTSRDGKQWRRFSFEDLVDLKFALNILGAERGRSRALRLKLLESACAQLRSEFGIKRPLREGLLRVTGTSVLVHVDGRCFEAGTRQLVFEETLQDVHAYVQCAPDRGEAKSARLVKAAARSAEIRLGRSAR